MPVGADGPRRRAGRGSWRSRVGRSTSSRLLHKQGTTVDKIFLRELRIETIIGFWEWERRIKQIVSIDLEIGTDARIAAASDGIVGTLNYEQLAKRLLEFVGASQFQMVEGLATA